MDQVSLREVMDSLVSIVQPQVRSKRQQFDVSISSSSTICWRVIFRYLAKTHSSAPSTREQARRTI